MSVGVHLSTNQSTRRPNLSLTNGSAGTAGAAGTDGAAGTADLDAGRATALPRNPSNGSASDNVSLSSESANGGSSSGNLSGLLGGLQENFSAETATAREGGRVRETGDARAVYRRHGEVDHSLSDRTEIGRLISRTPQVDNTSGTHNDEVRCGGAALMNAMLLDGGYEANARAIRTLADPALDDRGRPTSRTADGHNPFRMTEEQRAALAAMESGHMTPNQTAQVQEMLFQMTDGISDGSTGHEAGNDGIVRDDMEAMVRRLGAAGAFPNSREMNIRMDENGGGGYHWTSTVTTSHGTAHADSWPSSAHRGYDGYASVRGVSAEDRPNYVYRDGDDRGTFTDDVTLRRRHPIAAATVTSRELVVDGEGNESIQPA